MKARIAACALLLLCAAAGVDHLQRIGNQAPAEERREPRAQRRSPVLVHQGLALRQACSAAGITYPPRSLRVEIRKVDRVLALYSASTLIKEYEVALGGKPEGDKQREGDRRTPEGDFYICTRLPQSRFHRFLGISYPAPDDARIALATGRITRDQERAIAAAHRGKRQPPWKTALGGEIGIHGGGTGKDWTLGCIALANGDIDELFPLLSLGTPVTLHP